MGAFEKMIEKMVKRQVQNLLDTKPARNGHAKAKSSKTGHAKANGHVGAHSGPRWNPKVCVAPRCRCAAKGPRFGYLCLEKHAKLVGSKKALAWKEAARARS